MAIANPKIHVICGLCGSYHTFEYKIITELNDNTNEDELKVSIFCKNCGTLTRLDEIIEEIEKN